MRIFILTIGTRGDVEMFATLGQALARRGHQIVIGTSAFLSPCARARNLAWVQIGNGTAFQMGQILSEMSALPLAQRTKRFIHGWVKPQLDQGLATIVAYAQSADYFVNNLQMRLQRKGQVIPCASITYEVPEDRTKLVNQNCRQVVELVAMNRDLVDSPRVWPEHFRFTGFWTGRPTESFVPRPRIAGFLSQGPPPIVVTFGSMTPVVPGSLLRAIENAVAAAGARAVVLGRLVDSGSVLDAIEFADEEIPYDWLFPQAACVIHHGGLGTATSAIRAGVPSIVIPQVTAQQRLGDAMLTAGLSTAVLHAPTAPEKMSEILRATLVDDKARQRARIWGDRLKRDAGVEDAATAIEKHAL